MTTGPERWLRWSALAALLLALILVPFALFEEPLNEWSVASLQSSTRWTLGVVVVLLLVADVVLPIPSSLVSAAAMSLLGPWSGSFAVFAGLTLAALLGHACGRYGGAPLVTKVVGRAELARAKALLDRYGVWMILVCRGVPVLAEASTLFAGSVGFPWQRFLAIVILGNLGLTIAYAASASLGLADPWAMLVPFVTGIALPALMIWLVRKRVPATTLSD
ncbi:MAG TPA: VTT domain-containing protein [Polyangiaceae bacterium]|jgi:uncharacterized membrane protein YdjX (TVP38/TMEM64 family)|nr:VTT domain-containing protein [Polyangiaceae bacterium]